MKKILSLLLSVFLIVGLMSCDVIGGDDDNGNDTEEVVDNDTNNNTDDNNDDTTDTTSITDYTFQVDWDDYLNWGTFNARLTDADGNEVIAAQGGSEPAAVAGNTASTEGFFAGSSYNFMHDGSDSYGGVMTSFDGGTDLGDVTVVKVAIKGDVSGLDVIELQLGDAIGDQVLNILAYDSETSGDWDVYTIPLADYDSVDVSTFDWAAIWNPKATGYTLSDETGYGACDFLYDIAFN